jgi:hypothetical protein
MNKGRKKLPDAEKKIAVRVFVKAKHAKKAKKELQHIAKQLYA